MIRSSCRALAGAIVCGLLQRIAFLLITAPGTEPVFTVPSEGSMSIPVAVGISPYPGS